MRPVTVEEVMTRSVVSVREDTPFKEIARTMHQHGVSGVPVLDDDGQLRGIVSEADLLLFEEEPGEPRRRRSFVEWFIDPRRLAEIEARTEDVRARDFMTREVVTVTPHTPVRQASKLLLDAGVKRLPVLDVQGRVVGIVSRRDLLSPFLRSDEEIAREVREDVILGAMWIDPSMIRADVKGGVVHLEGRVDRRSVKEILVELVHRVDGVVGVKAEDLEYERDDRDIRPEPPRSELDWGENWVRHR